MFNILVKKRTHELYSSVRLEFRENIKMLAVPTNNISDQKYFVHLIRTSLTKSGTNFAPIRNVQYFGENFMEFHGIERVIF